MIYGLCYPTCKVRAYIIYRRNVAIPNECVYLRFKMLGADGRFTYSAVVLLRKQGAKAPFTIMNNPVKGTLNIEVGDVQLVEYYGEHQQYARVCCPYPFIEKYSGAN